MMAFFLQVVLVSLCIHHASCLSTKPQVKNNKKPVSASIGEAIQLASTQEELLDVASKFWLPTDADLPPHLRSQRVHHEKRQRWSAQLLEKMASASASPSMEGEDDRLERAVLAASIPFEGESDRPTKEGRYVWQALCGLHTLVGRLGDANMITSTATVEGVQQLIDRAEAMAAVLPLPHVVEMRFAARGLMARLFDEHNNLALPNMDQRVSKLPFDIAPRGVDWKQLATNKNDDASVVLRDAIPFHFDTITTRTGAAVVERRGTAWLAEAGIGALAYSGKLMPPKALPMVVSDTMRAVETAIGMPAEDSPYFDCALCNHYPDAEAACKFHTDPEHGTVWERLTCVVAAGDSRRFAFRPIPGMSEWSKWENAGTSIQQEETLPAVIHLFSGDIVQLWGECNDLFHHAVYVAEGDNHVSANGRVSLVLKRAKDRGGGTRGHGLQGEGRRGKRKGTPLSSLPVSDKPSSSNRSRRRRRRS